MASHAVHIIFPIDHRTIFSGFVASPTISVQGGVSEDKRSGLYSELR